MIMNSLLFHQKKGIKKPPLQLPTADLTGKRRSMPWHVQRVQVSPKVCFQSEGIRESFHERPPSASRLLDGKDRKLEPRFLICHELPSLVMPTSFWHPKSGYVNVASDLGLSCTIGGCSSALASRGKRRDPNEKWIWPASSRQMYFRRWANIAAEVVPFTCNGIEIIVCLSCVVTMVSYPNAMLTHCRFKILTVVN